MWPNPQEIADLVTFTEDILNEKVSYKQKKCIVSLRSIKSGSL